MSARIFTLRKRWPDSGIGGAFMTGLPMRMHFEQATARMQSEKIKADVTLGTDPQEHIAAINQLMDAGFDMPTCIRSARARGVIRF